MSDELVGEFYEYLVSSAERNRKDMGNALFLMAALQYVILNNLHGVSLNEILYKEHTRRIKDLFLRVARKRMENPESTWRAITNPRNPEMQNQIRKYGMEQGDVSKAFSELKPYRAKSLLEMFNERMDQKRASSQRAKSFQ